MDWLNKPQLFSVTTEWNIRHTSAIKQYAIICMRIANECTIQLMQTAGTNCVHLGRMHGDKDSWINELCRLSAALDNFTATQAGPRRRTVRCVCVCVMVFDQSICDHDAQFACACHEAESASQYMLCLIGAVFARTENSFAKFSLDVRLDKKKEMFTVKCREEKLCSTHRNRFGLCTREDGCSYTTMGQWCDCAYDKGQQK